MKLTKEERKQIYLDAAEYFKKSRNERRIILVGTIGGFCDYLEDILHNQKGGVKDYPEYSSLEPENHREYWFSYLDQTDRINALYKSAELCES